jgi:hypothetical protein
VGYNRLLSGIATKYIHVYSQSKLPFEFLGNVMMNSLNLCRFSENPMGFPKRPSTLWLCLTVCYWKLWFISWHFPLNMVIFDSFLYVYHRVIFPNCIPIYPHLVRISLEWVTTKKCLGCTPNWKPIISPFWVYISGIYLVYPNWIILNKFESS